jgi:competence protein ComEA
MKDYLVFSKGQRRASILLCIALGFCVFLPALNNYLQSTISAKADPIIIQQAAGLKVYSDSPKYYNNQPGTRARFQPHPRSESTKIAAPNRFIFDPNTASTSTWQQLGVKDKTIGTIQKYLAKGGHFYKPDDLKKVYGLRQDEVESLIPYARIEQQTAVAATKQTTAVSYYNNRQVKFLPIDINLADTSAYKSLPGIGSKLAARIVNFRSKLGGFYSVQQVGETFGLPDSTFQKIKYLLIISGTLIQKRNINTATAEELRMPYISYNLANAIVQFRLQHGNFSSVTDLKKIQLVDDVLFEKIAPYLAIE